jgi:hypothetical protein
VMMWRNYFSFNANGSSFKCSGITQMKETSENNLNVRKSYILQRCQIAVNLWQKNQIRKWTGIWQVVTMTSRWSKNMRVVTTD